MSGTLSSTMKRVLLTEPIHKVGMTVLQRRSDIEVVHLDDAAPKNLRAAIAAADAIIVRVAGLSASTLASAKRLLVVSKHGVGCDNIAVDHLSERGIPVAIAAGANATSVAEHTLALLLAVSRRLRDFDQATRSGNFHRRNQLCSIELNGRNALIIGFGRIGKKVAALYRALGMNVTVADIAIDAAQADALGCRGIVDFRPALADADVVSLHVPLDDTTRGFIGVQQIAQMKAGVIVINSARGGIIDETALHEALERGLIAGAGLDVFSEEPPPPDHPLLAQPKVVLSPHSAAMSDQATKATAIMAAKNVLDFFDGRLRRDCIFNFESLPHHDQCEGPQA